MRYCQPKQDNYKTSSAQAKTSILCLILLATFIVSLLKRKETFAYDLVCPFFHYTKKEVFH